MSAAVFVDDNWYARDRTEPLSLGGVLAVWSALEDRRFERRLPDGSFDVTVDRVRARRKKGGPRHVILLDTASFASA